ncbi:hypothetical protein F5141DRAFT_981798, partial [Pisolithus sp. B1]
FKAEYKDMYSTILETWKEAKELENMGGTLAQRQQVFDKSKKNLNHMFTALSKAHGFEGAYLLAGRVVNQDGGLGHVFMTPGTEQFFATRCRTGDDEIIGHFKAHIYNMVSLQAVEEVFEAPKTDGVDDEVEVHGPWPSTDIVTEEHGQRWCSGKLFPWKQMLRRLAASELVLVNWPEGVMFPGEERASRTMPKGISDLMRAECSKLLAALNDTEDTRLHIRSKAALISSEEPVIIGAAPPHDSNKSRGKHMFCNLKTDRLG